MGSGEDVRGKRRARRERERERCDAKHTQHDKNVLRKRTCSSKSCALHMTHRIDATRSSGLILASTEVKNPHAGHSTSVRSTPIAHNNLNISQSKLVSEARSHRDILSMSNRVSTYLHFASAVDCNAHRSTCDRQVLRAASCSQTRSTTRGSCCSSSTNQGSKRRRPPSEYQRSRHRLGKHFVRCQRRPRLNARSIFRAQAE